jgi:hypothetical protein
MQNMKQKTHNNVILNLFIFELIIDFQFIKEWTDFF